MEGVINQGWSFERSLQGDINQMVLNASRSKIIEIKLIIYTQCRTVVYAVQKMSL